MASLDRLPGELLFMIQDDIIDSSNDTERDLYSLSLTNRRFHYIFNTSLYKYDARGHHKAMMWGAFFGRVNTMEHSRVAGVNPRKQLYHDVLHPAVSRALGGFRPLLLPSVLATAGGQNHVLDWLLQRGITKGITAKGDMECGVRIGEISRASTWSSVWVWSPMFWAILYNHEHTVRYLLSHGVSPILNVKFGLTAMHAAAALGRETMFDLLLSLPGCSLLNAKDFAGNTPLHYAAGGSLDVDLAISLGGPLTYVVADNLKRRLPDVAKANSIANLVHRGADIHATNKKGQSPMVLALSERPSQWKAALQLLDLQPAGFVPSHNLIATVLAECTKQEPGNLRTAFLRRVLTPETLNRMYHVPGTPLNIGSLRAWHNNAGKSSAPLMWYIVQGCSSGMRWSLSPSAMEDTFVELLDLGAMPRGKDSRSRTPLHACVFAAMNGHPHWINHFPIDFPDKPLNPGDPLPLPKVATEVPFSFISILLKRGASLDAQDRKGVTPLEYALEKSYANATRDARIKVVAQNVVRLVLLQAWVVSGDFKSPSEDIKRRLVDKLGVGILAPLDPLKGDLDLSEETN